ncbi:ribonuclease H-like domain-containing protein [Amylocystis lapponica]|nr:ribonuclease H-like domain-containing protein [Amylocystis lapponica]
MAMRAFTESKLPASIRRLSPSSSPSRKASHTTSRLKSRLLDALDSQLSNTDILLPVDTEENVMDVAHKPLHPFFLSAGVPNAVQPVAKNIPATKSRSRAVTATSTSQSTDNTKEKENVVHPLYSYKDFEPPPVVVYTKHEEEADELVQTLQGPLGFDLEWRVFFRRNATPTERRTALVQLSDKRTILLVHAVIESPEIVKTGANIRNDGEKLFRDFGIVASNLVELGAFAQKADPAFSSVYRRSIVSLARMVELYTHKTLDKGKVRTGNWEANPLSQEQITYAANDAHCALVVYNCLLATAAEREITLYPATYACDLATVHAARKAALEAASTATPVSESTAAGSSTSPATSATVVTGRNISSSAVVTWTRPLGYMTSVHHPPRPQHLRAYDLWHNKKLPLPEICAVLRSKENPLAKSTVISYVVCALQSDPALSFSVERLRALARLEQGSWARHRDWIMKAESRSP